MSDIEAEEDAKLKDEERIQDEEEAMLRAQYLNSRYDSFDE